MHHSDYSGDIYGFHNPKNNLLPHLHRWARDLKTQTTEDGKALPKFAGIAVTGNSGVIPGVILSMLSGIPLVVVRKAKEYSHAEYDVETVLPTNAIGQLLFFDDRIASGETLETLLVRIGKTHHHLFVSHILLYHKVRTREFGIARLVGESDEDFDVAYHCRKSVKNAGKTLEEYRKTRASALNSLICAGTIPGAPRFTEPPMIEYTSTDYYLGKEVN